MLDKQPKVVMALMAGTSVDGEAKLPTEKLRRRTKTRDMLLSAARELMSARAKAGFTVDDIVQSAGVAKGSFYNHFADKEALAKEVFKTIRAKEEREIEAVNKSVQEPAVRIARAMSVYARFALTSPDEARIITQGQVDALSIQSSMNAGLVSDLAEGLRTGRLVTPSIEAAALLVIGQTAVLLSRLQIVNGRDAAASLAQQCIALTLLGLGLDHRAAHLASAQAVEEILRNKDEPACGGAMPEIG